MPNYADYDRLSVPYKFSDNLNTLHHLTFCRHPASCNIWISLSSGFRNFWNFTHVNMLLLLLRIVASMRGSQKGGQRGPNSWQLFLCLRWAKNPSPLALGGSVKNLRSCTVLQYKSGWVVTWFLFGYTAKKNVWLLFHNDVLSESK